MEFRRFGDTKSNKRKRYRRSNRSFIKRVSREESMIATIFEMVAAQLNSVLDFYSLGPIDEIRSILSGIEYNQVTGKVNSVKGIMNLWIFRHNGTKEKGQLSIDEKALNWEEEFIKKTILNPEVTKPDYIKIDGFAERRYVEMT